MLFKLIAILALLEVFGEYLKIENKSKSKGKLSPQDLLFMTVPFPINIILYKC